MKVTVENKKGLNKDLKVFIDKKTISSYMDEKYEEVKNTVTLKGFRPGKVPKEILKKQFGQAIFGEVLDKVLKDTSSKALIENKIKPAGQPKIDLKIYGEDKDYYFTSIGSAIPIEVVEDFAGTWFVLQGDWGNTRMMMGYTYDMEVHLPTIYPSKTQATNSGPVTTRDTRAYVNLHRLKINFGQNGVMETTLKILGRDDYTELYECKEMDDYPANEVAFEQDRTQVVPVYAKNTDTNIIISSHHPSPCTLFSLEWEGDYGAKWYKSV